MLPTGVITHVGALRVDSHLYPPRLSARAAQLAATVVGTLHFSSRPSAQLRGALMSTSFVATDFAVHPRQPPLAAAWRCRLLRGVRARSTA